MVCGVAPGRDEVHAESLPTFFRGNNELAYGDWSDPPGAMACDSADGMLPVLVVFRRPGTLARFSRVDLCPERRITVYV